MESKFAFICTCTMKIVKIVLQHWPAMIPKQNLTQYRKRDWTMEMANQKEDEKMDNDNNSRGRRLILLDDTTRED